ncbi:hypothetical protein [Agrococcus sp. SCSIO52902]|uniref:hypothetical protein n=1 Tax=Agrococcus sp. SCSIO52902 TaxID=2933290 RepID=UPI001FF1B4DF|nr:hypothetical protein [Agrococcus sp. SCSIO52902]UOW01402.1 hypothetical protein MU522_03035 [Agrococcus sp. SCSIO52902]
MRRGVDPLLHQPGGVVARASGDDLAAAREARRVERPVLLAVHEAARRGHLVAPALREREEVGREAQPRESGGCPVIVDPVEDGPHLVEVLDRHDLAGGQLHRPRGSGGGRGGRGGHAGDGERGGGGDGEQSAEHAASNAGAARGDGEPPFGAYPGACAGRERHGGLSQPALTTR